MGSKIAIIPARGGSKRIPRKNIKDFFGKPVIAYAIENALNAKIFDEIMVSTDDPKIAEIASSYGAEIPFLRSKKNASDYATTVDVLLEVLEFYKNNNRDFEWGCCIYPVTPLLTPNLLLESFFQMESRHYSTLCCVQEFPHPINRAMQLGAQGKIEMIDSSHTYKRTQDISSYFHDAGQFYWFEVTQLVQEKSLIGSNTMGFPLESMQAQDVDSLEDWKLAELKYQYLKTKHV